ncbi:hypothetical protein [Cellulomonas palmilytica]|uniref:hypothetical protein n=1 Tax=Cellulomonas palmilytica TaxID=2608402 RepID=UPI001F277B6D|nr:hypothetical protein [Cellulomonas palmilytica]UJP39431.1 hypothetical protein F1D97_14025 [Cellulomonas palmilytica]
MDDVIGTRVAEHLPVWTAFVTARLARAEALVAPLVAVETASDAVPWRPTSVAWSLQDGRGGATVESAVASTEGAVRVAAEVDLSVDDLQVPVRPTFSAAVVTVADLYVSTVVERVLARVTDRRDDDPRSVDPQHRWPVGGRVVGRGRAADHLASTRRAEVVNPKGLPLGVARGRVIEAVVLPALEAPRIELLDVPCVTWTRRNAGVRLLISRQFFVTPASGAIAFLRV